MTDEQAPREQKKGRSLPALFWGVIIHPRQTFTHLKNNHKKTRWVPAMLVLELTLAPLVAGRTAARQMPIAAIGEAGMTELDTENMFDDPDFSIVVPGEGESEPPPAGVAGICELCRGEGSQPLLGKDVVEGRGGTGRREDLYEGDAVAGGEHLAQLAQDAPAAKEAGRIVDAAPVAEGIYPPLPLTWGIGVLR